MSPPIPTFSIRVNPEHQPLVKQLVRLLRAHPEREGTIQRFIGQQFLPDDEPIQSQQGNALGDRLVSLEVRLAELERQVQALACHGEPETQYDELQCVTERENSVNPGVYCVTQRVTDAPGPGPAGDGQEPFTDVSQRNTTQNEGGNPDVCDATQRNTDQQEGGQPDTRSQVAVLLGELTKLEGEGLTLEAMAVALNGQGWVTQRGRPWTKDTLYLWRKKQRAGKE
ncbi:MAG: hypothetical protein HQL87_09575 [Magnetococcales bacterium]|nr:hypothetical protein [Magnetococcales bacterium]